MKQRNKHLNKIIKKENDLNSFIIFATIAIIAMLINILTTLEQQDLNFYQTPIISAFNG